MRLKKNQASVKVMQRAGILFICCFLLCAALRPALPVFVCSAMAGARLSHPCCPEELSGDPAEDANADGALVDQAAPPTRTFAAVCCRAKLPGLADSSRPPEPQRSLLTPASALTGTVLALPASFAPLKNSAPQRSELRPIGPAPPLRAVLRI